MNAPTASPVLLQFDFPFSGPWGADLAAAMTGLAHDIASEPGLIWKIWTENQTSSRAGGIYLFANAADAQRYLQKHTARLQSFGITGIVAHTFAVNAELTQVTRGPLMPTE